MRRKRQNIKDYTSNALLGHGKTLLYNRWRLLAPHPFEPEAVYDLLLTDEQHKAMEHLNKTMPTCMTRGSQVNVIFDLDATIETIHGTRHTAAFLELHLPWERIIPDTSTFRNVPPHKFHLSHLPSHMHDSIREWACNWLTAQAETSAVLAKFTALFRACNTIGQVKRVWPQVTSLLTERAQDKLAEAKVRSPYPESVVKRRIWDYKIVGLKSEWTPAALQWYDDRLTEALCLPMVYTEEDAHHDRWPMKIKMKVA